MLAFEVHLNGEKICTAGIGDPGVMTGIITWSLGDGKRRPKQEELELQVGGLASSSRTDQYLYWIKRSLQRGDAVSIRIIEARKVDRPKRRRAETAAHRRRQEERYVRQMAEQFGWKIVTK